MKRKVHEAAAILGVHPFNLVAYLVGLGVSFDSAWPEIEEDWIETVRGLDWQRFGHADRWAPEPSSPPGSLPLPAPAVSEAASQVIEKLWRKRNWGDNSVSWDTLRNHFCQHVQGLEDAIRELVARGYIVAEGPRGPFSLNGAQKGEIERIAKGRVSA